MGGVAELSSSSGQIPRLESVFCLGRVSSMRAMGDRIANQNRERIRDAASSSMKRRVMKGVARGVLHPDLVQVYLWLAAERHGRSRKSEVSRLSRWSRANGIFESSSIEQVVYSPRAT